MHAGKRIFFYIAGIVLVLGFYALLASQSMDSANTTKAKTAELDLLDLTQNKKFQAENPKYLRAVQSLIQMRGYECPTLTMLLVKGQSPYGSKLEALCGPDDGSHNTYVAMHYAVYPDRFKVNLCEEYGFMPKDCS